MSILSPVLALLAAIAARPARDPEDRRDMISLDLINQGLTRDLHEARYTIAALQGQIAALESRNLALSAQGQAIQLVGDYSPLQRLMRGDVARQIHTINARRLGAVVEFCNCVPARHDFLRQGSQCAE